MAHGVLRDYGGGVKKTIRTYIPMCEQQHRHSQHEIVCNVNMRVIPFPCFRV